ncbi:MAG: SHOCT domain-containing protein [Chloroflexota bacterium]|jgi:uncharacterized membrane protein
MYPYMYDGSFLVVVLMVAAPLVVLGLFAWLVASSARATEDTAMRIVRERFARGEIDKEQLGVLLQAL